MRRGKPQAIAGARRVAYACGSGALAIIWRGSMTLASLRFALGAGIGALVATAAFAQTQPAPAQAPAAAPAAAPAPAPFPPTATIGGHGYPGAGPTDQKLQAIPLPNGKKMYLLPATLETTQWGWFDNAQPPVLRVNSGDTIVMETMMHSHNQIVPARRSSKSRRRARTFRGADRTR